MKKDLKLAVIKKEGKIVRKVIGDELANLEKIIEGYQKAAPKAEFTVMRRYLVEEEMALMPLTPRF